MGRVGLTTGRLRHHYFGHPRKESRAQSFSEVEKGFRSTRYEKIVERAEAIRHAVAMAQPRDLVLSPAKAREISGVCRSPIPF